MQTDFRLGAKVEDQNGQALGEIKQLIMSQDNSQVAQLVIGGPNLTEARVVKADQISGVNQDKDTVRLSISKEQCEQLPVYNQQDFAQTAPDQKNAQHSSTEDQNKLVGGGYNLDPNTDLDPPGLANQSR